MNTLNVMNSFKDLKNVGNDGHRQLNNQHGGSLKELNKVGNKEDMNSNANADIRYRDKFMDNDNCCNKSGDRSLTIKTLMIKVS